MNLQSKKIRYLARIFLSVFVLTLIGSVVFLHKYFYQTLTQAKLVSLLRSKVAMHTLDMKTWKKVMGALDYKKAPLVHKGALPDNPFRATGLEQIEEGEIEEKK